MWFANSIFALMSSWIGMSKTVAMSAFLKKRKKKKRKCLKVGLKLLFISKREWWICPFCSWFNLIVGPEWKEISFSTSVFFPLNFQPATFQVFQPEAFLISIFLISLPLCVVLPQCRYQDSFLKVVHFAQWNICMNAHKYCTHTTESKLHEGITTFDVQQENKSACTWICAHQSPLVIVITKCNKSK